MYGVYYDHHCHFEVDYLARVTNTTLPCPGSNPHVHDLTIKKSKISDSGQYICALNVIKNTKGYWGVITNITVTVKNKVTPVTPDKNERSTPAQSSNDTMKYTPLYVVGALLIITVLVIAIYMMTKSIISKESKCVRVKRNRSGEDTNDPDCSPYAVAGREAELYSVVQLSALARDPADSAQRAEGQNVPSAEVYSIVRLNSTYEASPPQKDTDGSSPRAEHVVREGKQPEGTADTGRNVYETVKDDTDTYTYISQ
ncbi:hypothetical protein MATL_G00138410 [Megalops atlanticus]|uniref:Uncharacterized protein n=1 Tax=Megalops atlanticus TaxID=7932 RepID=A0A9D3PTU5_MEGAT|nr:hypothetical protein MATL_G00138410 [Megalops atlanticus]